MQLDLDYTKTQCPSRSQRITSFDTSKNAEPLYKEKEKLPVCPTKMTLKTMLVKYKWITKERQNWKTGRRMVKCGLLDTTQAPHSGTIACSGCSTAWTCQ